MASFDSLEPTAMASPGGLLNPRNLGADNLAPDLLNSQGPQADPWNYTPHWTQGFHPFAHPGNTGPIGVVTDPAFPPGYVPGVTDLPPNAVPQGGWNGNALARPAVPPAPYQTPNAQQFSPLPVAGDAPPPPPDVPDSYTTLTHNWFVDRATSAASSAYLAARYTKFAGDGWPGITKVFPGMKLEDWKAVGREELGKAIGYSWIIDTAIDGFTPLGNRTTSAATFIADIGTPLLVKSMLGKWGFVGSIAIGVGAHVLEKMLLEKPTTQS